MRLSTVVVLNCDGKIQKKEFPSQSSFVEVISQLLPSESVARVVAVQLGEQLLDLSRCLDDFEEEISIQPVFDIDKQGADLIAHGTTHLMAYAVKQLYPESQLATGPAIKNGFYYDFDDVVLVDDDLPKITKIMRAVILDCLPFIRKPLTLLEARKMFEGQRYKQDLIEDFTREGYLLTSYFLGDIFVDLCKGPHVPHTGFLSHFELSKIAGAYWKGRVDSPMLKRVYGFSFPTKKMLQSHLQMIEESLRRDHRKVGRDLEIFFTHEFSPGSPFLLPCGTRMYKSLQNALEKEYLVRGYEEVITPNIFHQDLWKQSGHWDHYRDNMFEVVGRDDVCYSLKPMNCPSHMLIYQQKPRSYRELPIRFADFGVLHRDELSGTLGGLTRVRRLCQDDSHIFCTMEQISKEIDELLSFIDEVYTKWFNFSYVIEVSTRPEKYMGSLELWDEAERALEGALKQREKKYEIKKGEGAFYGPKLDFQLQDAVGRLWQCATIQLDFQLPQRFSLVYEESGGEKKFVVVIHRAILGSLERFLGVLLEHYEGKFPFWIHHEPVRIITVSEKFHQFGQETMLRLREEGIYCGVDFRSESLSKKVRDAQKKKVFYILTIGQTEVDNKTVSVRSMSGGVFQGIDIEDFIKGCKFLQKTKSSKIDGFL